MNQQPEPEITVDASGTLCPEPILRARAGLARIAPGGVIAVITTDPLAEVDFEVFCQRTGHDLLAIEAAGNGQRFLIRRSSETR